MSSPEGYTIDRLPLHGVNGTAIIDPRTAVTTGLTESYLFGAQIPSGISNTRQTYQVMMWGQMTSNGVLTVRLRAGAATASGSSDANILHSLALPSASTTFQWVRYEALVTVTSAVAPNLIVAGIGHAWTGSTVVSPANAVAEKTVTLPLANPWHISVSAQSANSTSVFQVKHAWIKSL